MNSNYNNKISVDSTVVETIAGVEISKINNVSEIIPKPKPVDRFLNIINQTNNRFSVKAFCDKDNTWHIDINIVVKFGININDVANVVKNKVSNAVFVQTGKKVSSVNIFVIDIL